MDLAGLGEDSIPNRRYSELLRIQHVMYDWFKVLTHVAGRGVFYVYLGSVDVVSSYEVPRAGLGSRSVSDAYCVQRLKEVLYHSTHIPKRLRNR